MKTCCYCNRPIDNRSYDWGMTQVDYAMRYWHMECFEQFEQILIEEESTWS